MCHYLLCIVDLLYVDGSVFGVGNSDCILR